MSQIIDHHFAGSPVTNILGKRLYKVFHQCANPISEKEAQVMGMALSREKIALYSRVQDTDYNAVLFRKSLENLTNSPYIVVSETAYHLFHHLRDTKAPALLIEFEQRVSWLQETGYSFVKNPNTSKEIVWNNTCGSAPQVLSRNIGWIDRTDPTIKALSDRPPSLDRLF